MNRLKALIITGPTASGKTQLSEMIAEKFSCEIVNADVGQFYTPLSVGTAKPDLSTVSYKHHLFNIIDKPEDLSVVKYRSLVINSIKDICARGKIPVLVGGSLFYIKSLFFPPQEFSDSELSANQTKININELDKIQKWELLQKIDPERASMLHPNDSYRIGRALEIWIKTGQKPSNYKPKLETEIDALIIYVQPEIEILKKRICERTIQMIENGGWIEETEKLAGTGWETFLVKKGLIGYPEIFSWVKSGKIKNQLPILVEKIQIQTMQYAKRQRIFWKSFEKEILQACFKSGFLIQTMSVGLPDQKILSHILTEWNKFSNIK